MTNRTSPNVPFSKLGSRPVQCNFDGGDISSDGGVLLLRQIDKITGLTAAAANVMTDRRDPTRITHTMQEMLAQRIFGMCCGYEDLNDHDSLRNDSLMQTATNRSDSLASSPTLCRLENAATHQDAVALHTVLIDQFIASFDTPPTELVLDIDASDVPLHGQQEGIAFHGYYDHECFLPLYVFCGKAMLACILRECLIDGAKNAAAVIKLIIKRLRQEWPDVKFTVRGDSGFCRQRIIRWCERNDVNYVIGLARNSRLEDVVSFVELMLKDQFESTQEKQRWIDDFQYSAKTWGVERRVITRLEYGQLGNNPRFIVTNLSEDATHLYEELYCARGEAENRIKEAQLDLFGKRASCHCFVANQVRLLLAALAYTLMQRLKDIALKGTELARATSQTIRVKLLKIGASIMKNTRRIVVMLASKHPLKHVYEHAATAMATYT